jgi:ABC-type transporter lipoprotein component MlaA
VSIWFNLVAFHRAIVHPILRLYESVVINLVEWIIRNLKENLIFDGGFGLNSLGDYR